MPDFMVKYKSFLECGGVVLLFKTAGRVYVYRNCVFPAHPKKQLKYWLSVVVRDEHEHQPC